MADQATSAIARAMPSSAPRLEPDAIGWAQDVVIGMASAAPAASVGLTLAGLAAAAAYASGPVLLLTAIPMLVIANAYRRLNRWQANCGASFEWVGRAISPHLGFMTGWLMIAANAIGAVGTLVVLGPAVLAVAGSGSASTWPNLGITAGVCLLMLVIAVLGIRLTARTQVGVAAVEYVILIGVAIAGLTAVLSHRGGTVPMTRGWLSLRGVGGHGSLTVGLLAAVFLYGGWDGTIYVNEEVKHRRTNPGRAAIMAVALLALLYTLTFVGLQGVVSPAQLHNHSATALVYVAKALGGSGVAKAMALALALSVIATTGIGIVLGARIILGMATHRVLPAFLGNVSPRFATPVAASVGLGLLTLGLSVVYLLANSLQGAFNATVAIAGLLFASYYILTALALIVYYRRRVISGVWDAVSLGILPLGAAIFLGWIMAKSVQQAPAAQRWSLVAIVGVGLVLMLSARFIQRSPFFQIRRESYARQHLGQVGPLAFAQEGLRAP